MTPPIRGNPYLQVRVDEKFLEKLKETIGEGKAGGKAGGVSLFVRRLIYRELGEPLPSQWGEDVSTLNDLIEVTKEIDGYERDGDTKNALSLFRALVYAAPKEPDLVVRNASWALLGRLTALLMERGALKLDA